jgi:hypothetical protein
MEKSASSLVVFFPIGLVVARVVEVWHTRMLYHPRVAPAPSLSATARIRRG